MPRAPAPAPTRESVVRVVPGTFSIIDRTASAPRIRHTAPAPRPPASAPPPEVAKAEAEPRFDTWVFRGLVDRMFRPRVPARVPAPELTHDDVQLAIRWFESLERREESGRADRWRGGKWDLDQLLSARAAEIAAERFYAKIGLQPINVSLKQISDPADDAWTFYDLHAGGYPVDVKNARRPELSLPASSAPRMRYTEQCVSRFKNLPAGHEVRIAGVLSHHAWATALPALLSFGTDTQALILGELSPTAYRALAQRYQDDLLTEISSARPDNLHALFVPPWLYDYPEPVYRDRNEARQACAALCSSVDWQQAGMDPAPITLAAGAGLSAAQLDIDENGWEFAFYQRLLRHRASDSLPVLFLEVLRHFLLMLRTGGPTSYHPAAYRRLLFRPGCPAPLGIFDPLGTVDNLIGVADHLWRGRDAVVPAHGMRVTDYRIFRLTGTGLLQGRTGAQAKWETLAAYCGHCGEDPLLLHDCDLCGPHRRLVCHACGRCSNGCKGATSAPS